MLLQDNTLEKSVLKKVCIKVLPLNLKMRDDHDESSTVCIFMTSILVFLYLLEGYISTLEKSIKFSTASLFPSWGGEVFFVISFTETERLRMKYTLRFENVLI